MSLAKRSSGAKIRPYSPGTEDHLVRKRSPVRIRAWAPNSIRPFSLHLLDDFLSQRSRNEMLFRRALYPNLTLGGEATKRSFRRSATRRRVRPWLATRPRLSRQSLATRLL